MYTSIYTETYTDTHTRTPAPTHTDTYRHTEERWHADRHIQPESTMIGTFVESRTDRQTYTQTTSNRISEKYGYTQTRRTVESCIMIVTYYKELDRLTIIVTSRHIHKDCLSSIHI